MRRRRCFPAATFCSLPALAKRKRQVHFFEFDGTNFIKSGTRRVRRPSPTRTQRVLVLPTGQVFVTILWPPKAYLPQIYTPSGWPNPAWAAYDLSGTSTLIAGTTSSRSAARNSTDCRKARRTETMHRRLPITLWCALLILRPDMCSIAELTITARWEWPQALLPCPHTSDVPQSIESGPSMLEVVANGIPSIPVTVLVETGINSSLPSILPGGVVPVGSTSATIQPGEWVSIYGTNLASTTATWTGGVYHVARRHQRDDRWQACISFVCEPRADQFAETRTMWRPGSFPSWSRRPTEWRHRP